MVVTLECCYEILIGLVLEFEYGENWNLFAKKKKKDHLLKAPSVGKRNSARVDEGRKGWMTYLAINVQGTNCSGEVGEEPAT